MAPMALGRIDIEYRRVECTVPQDLNVIIDENRGAGGWIRLQVKVCAFWLVCAKALPGHHGPQARAPGYPRTMRRKEYWPDWKFLPA